MKYQPCPFRVHASWMTQERSFQIKTLVDEHKCVRNFNISNLLSPRWLARHFLKELIMKPNLKCKEMQSIIRNKFHYGVSWSKDYRTRCRAMIIIDGKLTEHYARVWDYCHELLRSNPGSTIQVGVTVNPDQTTYFHRMYLCFKAIKEGWKIGCHMVIGLDGSFLKGTCKGELLTTIGRDSNNQVYPRLDSDISHWTRGGVKGGVRGSRGGVMGSRGGRGGNRGGVVGNIGGVVANRGGRGSKRGGRGSKKGGRGSKTFVRVEGGGGAEVEEEYPPQTETQDGGEEIIPETQPESEEEEGINDTQELPVHLRIVKRRPSQRIVKNKLKKMGCVGTSTSSALELD
ncbi:unnamed protein product [Lactuca saligna]|uniref:Uncharacterized protein n=1 Tax=Lactuca saligna TaxID=75948 RepID=A0AA35YXT0_LACSI|nr:unnamed protein product [Lactuca saligna]